MGATRQFRSAGPMVLPPCTEAELARLRQAVKTSSKIKFLVKFFLKWPLLTVAKGFSSCIRFNHVRLFVV